jgi:hypothetical protein
MLLQGHQCLPGSVAEDVVISTARHLFGPDPPCAAATTQHSAGLGGTITCPYHADNPRLMRPLRYRELRMRLVFYGDYAAQARLGRARDAPEADAARNVKRRPGWGWAWRGAECVRPRTGPSGYGRCCASAARGCCARVLREAGLSWDVLGVSWLLGGRRGRGGRVRVGTRGAQGFGR